MIKRFLLLFSLAVACAGTLAALRPGADIVYWIAVIALAIAAPAAGLAVAAHAKLSRIKSDHALLCAKFDDAVYRLEKRNDVAQTRLTLLSPGGAPLAAQATTPLPENTPATPDEVATPILLTSAAMAKSPMPVKAGKAMARPSLPEKLARQRKTAGKAAQKPVDSQPVLLSLQPVLEMPDATLKAYIAFGRQGGQDWFADDALPEAFERAEFCDRLISLAIRNCEQLKDGSGAPVPVICGLTAEFVADPEKVKQLSSVMYARPSLARSLIFSVPAKMTGTVALQRVALDRLAATGVKFAVSGDLASLSTRKARAKLPLAFILAPAHAFSGDGQIDALRAIVLTARTECAEFVVLNADSQALQFALMDAGVRHVTSAEAAPPRLLKSEINSIAFGQAQSTAG